MAEAGTTAESVEVEAATARATVNELSARLQSAKDAKERDEAAAEAARASAAALETEQATFALRVAAAEEALVAAREAAKALEAERAPLRDAAEAAEADRAAAEEIAAALQAEMDGFVAARDEANRKSEALLSQVSKRAQGGGGARGASRVFPPGRRHIFFTGCPV